MADTKTPSVESKGSLILAELKDAGRYASTNYPGTFIAALIAVAVFFAGNWDALNSGVCALGEDAATNIIQTIPDVRGYEAERKKAEQNGEPGTFGKFVAKTVHLFADFLSIATDEAVKISTQNQKGGSSARADASSEKAEMGSQEPSSPAESSSKDAAKDVDDEGTRRMEEAVYGKKKARQ